MFLMCLRIDGEERRIEDEKNQFKQAMWSKVNSWLTQIDGRAGTDASAAGGSEENKADGSAFDQK